MTTYSKHSSILFDASAAAVMFTCILATGSAVAGPTIEQTPSEVVKFGELNLSAPAGVATLYSRIHAAALRVCSSGRRDLGQLAEERVCAQKAEAKAVQQVNVDALTAYFEKKTGRPVATFAANSVK
ncbi:MAG: UrcA family protein [Steroidobacteraceae bacterium]